ncbi:MAG: glycosyltransferase family 4 protein [Acidimicrobiales bacterium]
MKHLLVTNDFPPKHGGIQSYLWELWRRLPPDEVTVLTTAFPGAREWDSTQPYRIVRSAGRVLLPTPALVRTVDALATEVGAELVMLDPALPVGLIGPRLERPYGVVLHGAEVTMPARAPISRRLLRQVLIGARTVIAAGGYPADEGERAAGRGLPVTLVPPGVDTGRFVPLGATARADVRRRHGLPAEGPLIVSVSRLVPRKGMDVLIEASARLRRRHPAHLVAIIGGGRDRRRLQRLIADTGAPVRLLGRLPDADLPGIYGCGDVFAMLCRNRWLGLEQEGFGIVFLEAAAAGVPQVAGNSGGSAEAVVHDETGLVMDRPEDVAAVSAALDSMLSDPERRRQMSTSGRDRAEREFSYDVLAGRLQAALSASP